MRTRTVLGIVSAAFGIAAPSASADPYVALGDSVAANQGSYVAKLYPKFQQSSVAANELLNRAVGGQSSSSMISGGQLSAALADINAASDTKAVTIDIGGNDRFQCQSAWDDPGTCPFRANLASILTQLQTALDSDPGTEAFAAMAYYNPGVGTSTEDSYDVGLLGDNRVVGLSDTGADAGLNDVIYQEAAKLGITVADVYPRFKQGGQSLMSGDQIHPNQAGHQAIADVFCAALDPACVDSTPDPDPTPADTTAPNTTITKAPDDKLDRDKAKYKFGSSEPNSTYECKLDRKAYAACTSPKTLKHLGPGRHTFRVRATDAAGNTDQTPAVDRFKVLGD